MIKILIIAQLVFLVANITWQLFDEQKIFWVSLAILLVAFNYYIFKTYKGGNQTVILLEYFLWLSYGNLVKQIFYSETLKQINDYVWGSLLTIYLIYRLWATRKQIFGKR